MSNDLLQLGPRINEVSDPVRRFGFQDKTDSDLAINLYLESLTYLNDALTEPYFSERKKHFSRAFGSLLQSLQADPHYECPKVGAVVVGEILEELGQEVGSVLDGIDYAVSLGNHVSADRCQVLQSSWQFLQKLRSNQHTYLVFDYSSDLDLFDKISESVKKQAEVGYLVKVQAAQRILYEMELDNLQLGVSLEGVIVTTPSYEDHQKVTMVVRGDGIVGKLSKLLEQYHFKLK